MTLKQLEYAIIVAKTGNITKASELLFIAQPSLTHSIMELEEEMGIKIFNRTNKGITTTQEGERFLSYARQVVDQAKLLEEKFKGGEERKTQFSVSCQHYSFCVTALSLLIKNHDSKKYDFTLRETQTHEILEDVANLKSEIGILYLSDNNRSVIEKMIKKYDLIFTPLFSADPHVFISKDHPLASKDLITFDDMKPYPYITYEQGEYNSFYFSEEFMSNIDTEKNIIVRDRATLFNLVASLNGYTVSSGIILKDVNSSSIIAKKFDYPAKMEIGYISHKSIPLSPFAKEYLDNIKSCIE